MARPSFNIIVHVAAGSIPGWDSTLSGVD